jgi:hypothetical protein
MYAEKFGFCKRRVIFVPGSSKNARAHSEHKRT